MDTGADVENRAVLTESGRAAGVSVLVADDAPMRLGIRMGLPREARVCAEAASAEQAIRSAKHRQPDVCLIGRHLCGDGMWTVRGICRAAPNAAVVVLTPTRNEDDLVDAVRAGAVGYVPGTLNPDQLGRIIRAVTSHEAVVPRSMVLELLLELRGGGTGADALTNREAQVLGMLRRGHSTATIANRLEIAPVTVRRHISELVHKLGVENRSALTGRAWWTNGHLSHEEAAQQA